MARLSITRPRRFLNGFRRYRIRVDDRPAVRIGNGEDVAIAIGPGRHEVAARLDFLRSPPLVIDVDEHVATRIWVGSNQDRGLLKVVWYLAVLPAAVIPMISIAGERLFSDPSDGLWFSMFTSPMAVLPWFLYAVVLYIWRDHVLYLEEVPPRGDPGRPVASTRGYPVRIRLRVRDLMAVVAALAVLLAILVQWARYTRGEAFQQRARIHAEQEAFCRRMGQEYGEDPATAARADYHVAMRRKYQEAIAAGRIWVEPDPPPP